MTLLVALLGVAGAHPYADEAVRPEQGRCDPEHWLWAARAYADEQRQQEAQEALDRAAACGADPVGVLSHAALIAARLQPPERALPLLDEALELSPEHQGLRLARARAEMALGMASAAAADWERALAQPGSPQPDDVLGWAQALARSGQHRQALDKLDTFIAQLGPVPALVEAALQLELELGWTAAAQARADGLPDTAFWRARRELVLQRRFP